MPELGDRKRFAIQWEFNEKAPSLLMYGNVCFWVADKMIGDYDHETSLTDVLGQLAYRVGDCGDRESARFCPLSAQDAFAMIWEAFYGPDSSPYESAVEDERWDRFKAWPFVEAFRGYQLYLFDCPTSSRLIVGRFSQEVCKYEYFWEQSLRRGEFDSVVREFQDTLLKAYQAYVV